ncbi:MAG: class I adenylate-forming enzyme family protein [Acidimicrobiales bacterium]
MSIYDERPWLARYNADCPKDIEVEFASALAMWDATVKRAPDKTLIKYFDGQLTVKEVDEMGDALASALLDHGFQRGDRLGVYMQNVPAFVISMVATWKAGWIMVSINPMNKERELKVILDDCGATVLICHPDLYERYGSQVVPSTAIKTVITASELDFQTRDDERAFAGVKRSAPVGTLELQALLERYKGKKPSDPGLGPDDVAFLTYTSGTTGPPKGAMTTHRNIVFNAQSYRDWIGLTSDDVVLGVAPLFHITGLIGHIAIAMLLPATLVLAYRFEPSMILDAIREAKATFTVGSITVFIAMMNVPGAKAEDISSMTKIYSGGAPIPPSTVEEFKSRMGHYIHNIYGLTETTSPSHAVPLWGTAPVDPASGALSVGVPIFNTIVRIASEDGADLPVGEIGELITEGPEVVVGYWQKPEETEKALGGGRLRTGDVGYMDKDGWFYIVDRKKDQINVSGYKVWPREVEDVLYQHPAVREAAAVGVPDEYRGETVKAIVSLRAGKTVEPQELIEFCKERMAAYKYPRIVEIIDELPKTVTGKILRRELREQSTKS